MTEKERWIVDDAGTLIDMQTRNTYDYVSDVCPLLNALNDENEQLKQQNQEYQAILQDMGILLTDNEVINLRNEIADKLLKPMFKSNGFDVDIDTADGFTIIPKGDVE